MLPSNRPCPPQARLWVQLMRELRHGVKLKKVQEKQFNPLPTEYQLTPFEMLMQDIRARNYKLRKVMVSLGGPGQGWATAGQGQPQCRYAVSFIRPPCTPDRPAWGSRQTYLGVPHPAGPALDTSMVFPWVMGLPACAWVPLPCPSAASHAIPADLWPLPRPSFSLPCMSRWTATSPRG